MTAPPAAGTVAGAATDPGPVEIDLADPALYIAAMPYQQYAALRERPSLYWNRFIARDTIADDPGFWAVTRHADVKEVSTRADVFSAHEKTAFMRLGEAMTPDELEFQKLMLINLDPPDHTKLRGIVQKVFTPRSVARLEARLREFTDQVITNALAKGSGNFVEDVAAELPLLAIAELIGIPLQDRARIFEWSNKMLAFDDRDVTADPSIGTEAAIQVYAYADELGEQRRSCPMNDIVSSLVHADIDGHKLEQMEFDLFFLILIVAGNETTRNAITHGMINFFEHPDQWELYKRERPKTTADEIVRMAAPVMNFQRTALRDVELSDGQVIKAGERAVMFYGAANRDPAVFTDPDRFDITRDPNPHLGFGIGPHFCLGSSLARLEIDIMFNAIADRIPEITATGPAVRLRSSFINGIKELPVSFTG